MEIDPEVVWKVVLIDAIGVEFTEELSKTSSRVLTDGTASVDRRAGVLDSEAASEVELASLEVELGYVTPLVSRFSTISFKRDSASLWRKTWAVMDPLYCQLSPFSVVVTYSETLTRRLSEILKVPATSL